MKIEKLKPIPKDDKYFWYIAEYTLQIPNAGYRIFGANQWKAWVVDTKTPIPVRINDDLRVCMVEDIESGKTVGAISTAVLNACAMTGNIDAVVRYIVDNLSSDSHLLDSVKSTIKDKRTRERYLPLIVNDVTPSGFRLVSVLARRSREVKGYSISRWGLVQCNSTGLFYKEERTEPKRYVATMRITSNLTEKTVTPNTWFTVNMLMASGSDLSNVGDGQMVFAFTDEVTDEPYIAYGIKDEMLAYLESRRAEAMKKCQ